MCCMFILYLFFFYSFLLFSFFFFNDTATTEIYTLSLHDALPISFKTPINLAFSSLKSSSGLTRLSMVNQQVSGTALKFVPPPDRKSTRLNSSHTVISYAVFCLKKKIYLNYVERFNKIEF